MNPVQPYRWGELCSAISLGRTLFSRITGQNPVLPYHWAELCFAILSGRTPFWHNVGPLPYRRAVTISSGSCHIVGQTPIMPYCRVRLLCRSLGGTSLPNYRAEFCRTPFCRPLGQNLVLPSPWQNHVLPSYWAKSSSAGSMGRTSFCRLNGQNPA